MAIKGQQLKKEIQNKILEIFPNSFLYNDDKEIRICGIEDGAEIQIKVALTCAKTNVSIGEDTALPGDFPAPINSKPTEIPTLIPTTAEEKQNVTAMLEALGLPVHK